jgi:hypothetical protein
MPGSTLTAAVVGAALAGGRPIEDDAAAAWCW